MFFPSNLFPPLSRLTHGAVLLAALGGLLVALPTMAETTATDDAAPAATAAQGIAAVPAETPSAANPVTCEYGCEEHRAGTEICINKEQRRCSAKGWEPTGRICTPPPPVVIQ